MAGAAVLSQAQYLPDKNVCKIRVTAGGIQVRKICFHMPD